MGRPSNAMVNSVTNQCLNSHLSNSSVCFAFRSSMIFWYSSSFWVSMLSGSAFRTPELSAAARHPAAT